MSAPTRGYVRRLLVSGVDLGNGKRVRVWLEMGTFGVRVRRWHGRKAWGVGPVEAAEVVARRGQVNYARLSLARAIGKIGGTEVA